MEKEPLISIVIPLYNVAQYVAACLDSCQAQTLQDWEVLIVNDGSSDESGSIAAEYARQDLRIRYFEQENQGAVVARNVGIHHASGQWITFLDADDRLTPDALQLLYNGVCLNNSDISVGTFAICDEAGKVVRKKSAQYEGENTPEGFACALLTERISFTLCGKLFRKKLFERVVPMPELKIGEDAFITLQLFNGTSRIAMVSEVVYLYVQRQSSVTHSPTQAAINTILKFVEATIGYYREQIFFNAPEFTVSLNYFIIKEYFSYLRMGGKYTHTSVRDMLENYCLKDRVACRMTPSWRLMMLKTYRTGEWNGKLFRFVFVYLRSCFR